MRPVIISRLLGSQNLLLDSNSDDLYILNFELAHHTTLYQWQRKLDALGEEIFLAYKPSFRGRGMKRIAPEQEKTVVDTWGHYPGFDPS